MTVSIAICMNPVRNTDKLRAKILQSGTQTGGSFVTYPDAVLTFQKKEPASVIKPSTTFVYHGE